MSVASPDRSKQQKHVVARASLYALIVVAFSAVLCVAAEGDQRLRVKGSVLMANGVDDLAKVYMKEHPGSIIVVSGGGTNKGIADFLDKNVELAMATRELSAEELKTAAGKGIAPVKHIAAYGCITIIVHPENPVSELSMDQVRGIFTGDIKNWNQVRGPDRPIDIYLPDPEKHGTNRFFVEHVLKGSPLKPDAKTRADYPRIIRDVSTEKDAVAFCVLSKAMGAGSQIKMLAIQKDQTSAAVLPSPATAADRSYPISRPLFYYWDGNGATPLLKDFVAFSDKAKLRLR